MWKDADTSSATALVLALRTHGVVGEDRFAVHCVLSSLDLWCVTEVTMKADVEPSTQALPSEERRRRSHKTLVEVPPKQSHQPNELVENAVRRLESLIRTYEAELEATLSKRIGASALILPGLVRHGGFVLTRFTVEADGRSSCARLRGREYTIALSITAGLRGVLGRRLVASSFVGVCPKAGGRDRNTTGFLASRGTCAACSGNTGGQRRKTSQNENVRGEEGSNARLSSLRGSLQHPQPSCRAKFEEILGGPGDGPLRIGTLGAAPFRFPCLSLVQKLYGTCRTNGPPLHFLTNLTNPATSRSLPLPTLQETYNTPVAHTTLHTCTST